MNFSLPLIQLGKYRSQIFGMPCIIRMPFLKEGMPVSILVLEKRILENL